MNNLKNKTALITGATSGIGKSSAKYLAKMGINLILTGRRKERLLRLKQKLSKKYSIKVKIVTFDVTNNNQVEKKLTKIINKQNIDILINNAGLALGIEKIDEGVLSNWENMIDTNLKGLLYVSRIIIPHMRKNNSGHIINIGSIAVHSLSESMNIDLIGTEIRVSNIAPGAVKTEFSDVRFKNDKVKSDAVYQGYEPLLAKDIAKLAIYILNAPKHVNIQHTLVMPTAQRSPYLLHRNV